MIYSIIALNFSSFLKLFFDVLIFEFENKAEDVVYQRENDCLVIKPRAIVLIGSKDELSVDEMKYLRILNSSYHNISIVTYQQLLIRAENMLEINNGEKK